MVIFPLAFFNQLKRASPHSLGRLKDNCDDSQTDSDLIFNTAMKKQTRLQIMRHPKRHRQTGRQPRDDNKEKYNFYFQQEECQQKWKCIN